MEANQIIIIAVITSIILSIIVGFIVLTIIKHKYPAILTKKIYFESLFNYNINFTPEVIYFITNALTNPALYNISNSVIYNIHNGVGIWTNNNIINIITHDNIYTLDFLDNDDLSFESNVEPDDLRITSISFENKDLFIEFVNNLIRCISKIRRDNLQEDIIIL